MLHFTFSENYKEIRKNLKSGYLQKITIKYFLQSCSCLFSACGCSPGCYVGPRNFEMTKSEEYSETIFLSGLWDTTLPCGVELRDWLLYGQRSMMRSRFLFIEETNSHPELCARGCAALLFHLGRVLWQYKPYHSIIHRARDTEKW